LAEAAEAAALLEVLVLYLAEVAQVALLLGGYKYLHHQVFIVELAQGVLEV
jgi:hypothetical protein